MFIRVFFDVEIDRENLKRFHGNVQDALADVFLEESVMPIDGVRVKDITGDDKDE